MKNLLTTLVIAIAMISCKSQTENIEIQQEQNIQLVQSLFEHFNNHDWKEMASLYTNPAEFKDPSFGIDLVSQTNDEIIAKYDELNAIFSDIHDEVIQVYPSGINHVIVEFVSTGTAPDGSTFKLPICTILTIEKGKITKDFNYYDNFDENGGE